MYRTVLLVGLSLMITGCGDGGPAVSPVTGKVTIDGNQAPEGATITFMGNGITAGGTVASDGTYKLFSGTSNPKEGAQPGKYSVSIAPPEGGSGSQFTPPDEGGVQPDPSEIGKQYNPDVDDKKRNKKQNYTITEAMSLANEVEVVSGENKIDLAFESKK